MEMTFDEYEGFDKEAFERHQKRPDWLKNMIRDNQKKRAEKKTDDSDIEQYIDIPEDKKNKNKAQIVRTDGSAHNIGLDNYQRAAIGIYFETLNEGRGFYLGDNISSNMAEYEALIAAIKISSFLAFKNVIVYSDSELMCRHWSGEYKVKHQNIIPLFSLAKELSSTFESFQLIHNTRDHNVVADKLCEMAIKTRNQFSRPSEWKRSETAKNYTSPDCERYSK